MKTLIEPFYFLVGLTYKNGIYKNVILGKYAENEHVAEIKIKKHINNNFQNFSDFETIKIYSKNDKDYDFASRFFSDREYPYSWTFIVILTYITGTQKEIHFKRSGFELESAKKEVKSVLELKFDGLSEIFIAKSYLSAEYDSFYKG